MAVLMPLVEITLYQGRTREQKAAIAKAVSEVLIEVGNAAQDSVHVIFRDCDRDDWFKSRDLVEPTEETS